jgi:hypothetical protein
VSVPLTELLELLLSYREFSEGCIILSLDEQYHQDFPSRDTVVEDELGHILQMVRLVHHGVQLDIDVIRVSGVEIVDSSQSSYGDPYMVSEASTQFLLDVIVLAITADSHLVQVAPVVFDPDLRHPARIGHNRSLDAKLLSELDILAQVLVQEGLTTSEVNLLHIALRLQRANQLESLLLGQ